MKRNQIPAFVLGLCISPVVAGLLSPAVAALKTEIIEVYKNSITVYVDDAKLDPKDANGSPVDVLVYNGTTYLPLRAVANALSVPVLYEGSTQSAFLGKHIGASYDLWSACPPYKGGRKEDVTMAGKTYANAFVADYNDDALFNLNGQYNKLSFDFGHRDNESRSDSIIKIYLDGELAYTLEGTSEMLVKHYDLDLHHALQMKIERSSWAYCYALGNPKLS